MFTINKDTASPKAFKSLKLSLIFTFLSLSLTVLLVSTILQVFFNFQTQQAVLKSQQKLVAQDAASQVKNYIENKSNVLQTVVTFENLSNITQENRKIVLDKLFGKDPAFRRVAILDDQQKEVIREARLSNEQAMQLTPKIKDAIYSQARQGKTYITPISIDKETNEPLVIIAKPIMDVFGDFKGVLLTEVDLKFMWDLVGNIKIGNKGVTYVVDKQGYLIAFGDVSRVLKRENLSKKKAVSQFITNKKEDANIDTSEGIQDTWVVSTFVPLGTPDWAVVVELPVFEAYQSLINQIIISAIILFVISVTATIAGIYLSQNITKPIIDLTEATKKIGQGFLDTKIEVKTNNEIGELATSFNQMFDKIKEYQQVLQQKVFAQTKEIETALEEANKTKRAMLNLLEDAKSLESQLKTEKEGVEKKVVERTKELHDEQIKLEASINSLSVGFILVDHDNNIAIINQTAKMNFCASEASPLATVKDCSLLHIEDELKGIIDIREYINRCLTQKKTITINELAFHKKFLKIIITPIIAIGVIGAVILVEDITETKIMERSKDEFFSIASHELRTPLTAIRGNTSMIQQFYAEKIKDPELSEMISDIHESSTRLIEIVNDFLDTSRLEMGKMEFKKESFDIVELAKDTIKEYMTTGSMKKLYLTINDPQTPLPQVLADRNKIKQVVINLIGNAIKFTEVGGITLKFEKIDDFVKVYIVDTGKGISPASQNLLFRKFQQAQDNILTRDTTKGTGLGLYISKMMIEGMGGAVKIESSEIGKGTTFSITIPIATSATTTVPSPAVQVPNQQTPAAPQPLNTPTHIPAPATV